MISINIKLQQRLAPACLAALWHKTHCHLFWQGPVISIVFHMDLQHIASQSYALLSSDCSLGADRLHYQLRQDDQSAQLT